jgi:hypothetical protein
VAGKHKIEEYTEAYIGCTSGAKELLYVRRKSNNKGYVVTASRMDGSCQADCKSHDDALRHATHYIKHGSWPLTRDEKG